jgi:hypothetical protein
MIEVNNKYWAHQLACGISIQQIGTFLMAAIGGRLSII